MAASQESLPDKHLFNMRYGERRLNLAVAMYAIANILYLILYLLEPGSVAIFDPAIESIAPNIPVIYRPVNWLIEHGNPDRAELVKHIYGFNWLVFLFFFPGFLTFALWQTWEFYEKHKNFSFSPTRKLPTYQRALLVYIAIVILFLFLLSAWMIDFFYSGTFEFRNIACLSRNCVHKRNWDLIILTVISTCYLYLFQLSFYAAVSIYCLLRDRLNTTHRASK